MGNCRSCQWVAICAQAAHGWTSVLTHGQLMTNPWAAPEFTREQPANCPLVMLQQTMGSQFRVIWNWTVVMPFLSGFALSHRFIAWFRRVWQTRTGGFGRAIVCWRSKVSWHTRWVRQKRGFCWRRPPICSTWCWADANRKRPKRTRLLCLFADWRSPKVWSMSILND